jgi:hypothetical protein
VPVSAELPKKPKPIAGPVHRSDIDLNDCNVTKYNGMKTLFSSKHKN